MQNHAEDLAPLDDLLARYGRRRIGAPCPVAGGTVNETLRVETDAGALFVRRYAPAAHPDQIALEHRAIDWAAVHGLPVNPPLPADDGVTVQRVGGRWWAVFPWLDGRHIEPDEFDAETAATLGATLGLLHATLPAFDDPALDSRGPLQWRTTDTLAEIAAVAAAVRAEPTLGDERAAILDGLRLRRRLLREQARPTADFAALTAQTVHGDFHGRNVIVDAAGAVQAVIDWEMVRRLPAVYEMLRGLTFMRLLDSPMLADFLAGYRSHAPIADADCALGVELWWQQRLHSTWFFRSRFLDGDHRAHQFIAGEADLLRRYADPRARADLVRRLLRRN